MTKAQLAELVSVSPTAIGNYCNGRIPKADELYRISNALRVTMEWLLTGDEDHASIVQEAEAIYRLTTGRDREVKKIAAEMIKLGQQLQALFA